MKVKRICINAYHILIPGILTKNLLLTWPLQKKRKGKVK